jgi:enolase-phosphatase E1
MKVSGPRIYLLDVEGTVAPIAFVYEQLFPYARAHFEEFLQWNVAHVQEDFLGNLNQLIVENLSEQDSDAPKILPVIDEKTVSANPSAFVQKVLAYVLWLMDRDRKSTALKSLQGKIWKAGFESGELKGTLFADVPAALARWAAHGQVAIYSSGSVEAQKLLFRYSTCGDLTPLIAGYFDTRTGPKQASSSYASIAAAMQAEPDEVLFFSDVVRELDPAREAGCQTRLVVREGNAPVEDAHGHVVVESFAQL